MRSLSEFKKKMVSLMVLAALALVAAGCGGGGGGGGAASTGGTTGGGGQTASRPVTISGGTNQTAARVAGREAAAPVANTSIIAYWVKNASKTPLNVNGTADKTDANGNFSFTIDIGSNTSLDVVVEVLTAAAGSDANVRLALDNLAANATGQTIDAETTQSADFFILTPDSSLAEIDETVDMLIDAGVDLADIDSKAEVEALMTEVGGAVDGCATFTDEATRANCYVEQLDPSALPADAADALEALEVDYVIDSGAGTPAMELFALDKTQDYDTIQKITALAALGGYTDFSSINTAAELGELVTAMQGALAAYDNAALTGNDRLIAIKRALLASAIVNDFASSDVESLIIDLRSAYLNARIADAAEDLSDNVNFDEMLSVVSGFDMIEWMFLDVLTAEGFSGDDAVEIFDALVAALGYFGDYSSAANSSALMDQFVTMWDLVAFQAELATVLEPFGMGDTTKTEDLARLAHDLEALGSGHTRSQVEGVFLNYLTAATTAKAMALYDDYYGKMDCSFDVISRTITGSNCPNLSEIIDLLETHFERDLTLLENTINNLGLWIQSSENSTKVIGIGTGLTNAQTLLNRMKQSAATHDDLEEALDEAGVSPKLFDLVINLEPYM